MASNPHGKALGLPMLAIGYIRVSTDEQAHSGLGLDAQRATLGAEAAHRGWDIEIVEDAGYTGTNMRRPALNEILQRLDSCESESTLIVAKLDRLSRSLVDFASLMERSKKHGWSLVCLDLGVDTSTPQGKMVANIFATFAEFESDLIGQRTSDALQSLKRQGVKLGRPRTVCDQAITHIANLRSFGCSYRRIAQYLNEERVPTAQGGKWHPETVRQIASREA